MNKKQIILSIILFCTIINNAQNKRNLNLNDAILFGIKNSKELKLSDSQLEIAKLQIANVKNQQLPDFKISGMANYLPYSNLDIPALSSENGPSVNYILMAQAALSIPIFSGFKISNGIAVAKYNLQLQESNAAAKQQDIIMRIVDIYISLYKMNETKRVVEANLTRAKENERNFANMEKNGIVARNDLLSMQLQVSNVKQTLAETIKNINLINYNLNILLGLSTDSINIPDINTESVTFMSKEECEAQAKNNREEYHALEIQDEIALKNISTAKGGYYPSISLSASDINLHLNNLGNISNATMAGVSISYNLSSLYKNKQAVDIAKYEQIQIQENKSILDDQIRSKIYEARENYIFNLDKINVYEEALEQASENYRIVANKQANGLATTNDLLTADVGQLQAEINKVYGNADVLHAYYILLKEVGIISNIK